jgi:hypothetical protein
MVSGHKLSVPSADVINPQRQQQLTIVCCCSLSTYLDIKLSSIVIVIIFVYTVLIFHTPTLTERLDSVVLQYRYLPVVNRRIKEL